MIDGNEQILDCHADIQKVRARLKVHVGHGHATSQDVEIGVRIVQLAGIYGYKSYFGDFCMTLYKESEGRFDQIIIDFGNWPHAVSLVHTLNNRETLQEQSFLGDEQP
jgi:hypothetical protein